MKRRLNFDYMQPVGESGVRFLRDFDSGSRRRKALFLCQCGNEFISRVDAVRRNETSSCGCLRKKRTLEALVTHGDSGGRLYKCYMAMKGRCINKDHQSYKYYGARGISVFKEWLDSYEEFKKWALNNGYEEWLQLDRINNNESYTPKNCRWVTARQNMTNTRRSTIWVTPDGEFDSLRLACEFYGKDIHTRFRNGWDGYYKRKKYEDNRLYRSKRAANT